MHKRNTIALALGMLWIPTVCAAQAGAEERIVRVTDRTLGGEIRPTVDPVPAPPPASTDPYGFVGLLNQYRAAHGLGPVSFDANLSAWASQNNAAQSHRGLGHHVNPNCFQNSAWNCVNALDVATAWMNSRGHRANMLNPGISRVGIAYGPGPYWTMNAQ